MKFAYITAALLGLAYANPIVKAPVEDSLDLLDAREEKDVLFVEERDFDDADIFDEFDALFTELEAREAELDLEDDEDEITSEIEARKAKGILNALHKVRGGISAVNKHLNKFSNKGGPSTGQAVDLQKAANKLTGDVQAATKAAQKSKKLSGKASKKVFKYIKNTIKPATLNSLHNFRDHAPGLKKKGFGGIVKSRLGNLKNVVGNLGNALINKAGSKKVKKNGKKVLGQIQHAFKKTINAY